MSYCYSDDDDDDDVFIDDHSGDSEYSDLHDGEDQVGSDNDFYDNGDCKFLYQHSYSEDDDCLLSDDESMVSCDEDPASNCNLDFSEDQLDMWQDLSSSYYYYAEEDLEYVSDYRKPSVIGLSHAPPAGKADTAVRTSGATNVRHHNRGATPKSWSVD